MNERLGLELSPNEFRRVIRHLRSGVPSPAAARMATVGTDAVEAELERRESCWLNGNSPSNMTFILGDWGFGKTHLRMLLVDSFLRRGVPFIHDHVDGKSGSLAHLHRTVPRWLESIEVGPHIGLRGVIEGALRDLARIRDWCCKRQTSFANVLLVATSGNEWAWSLVAGHQYQFPEYSYYHFKALELLIEAANLFSAFAKGGIVLLLDEAENVSRQHDVRGRRKTYDTLSRLASQRSLCTFVFVTDRFFSQVEEDKERARWQGWGLWTQEALGFVSRIAAVPIIRPPLITGSLAKALVERIAEMYARAFRCPVPAGFSGYVLDAWSQAATRSVRLLVRMTIDVLDRIAQ